MLCLKMHPNGTEMLRDGFLFKILTVSEQSTNIQGIEGKENTDQNTLVLMRSLKLLNNL